ncbi:MAG: sensor histidine kinase [Acidimicrobiales bacterium]
MERSVLQGLAVFRWGAWVWMAAVLVVSRTAVARPVLAAGLVALALAVTVADTVLLAADPAALCRPWPVVAELAVGAGLVVADGWAYGPHHAFSTSQSLGSVWPLAGVLAAGVALGPLVAAGAGVAVGVARVGATVANGAAIDTGGKVLSLANTVVFYALGGAASGYLAGLLRRAERQISAARAREEVARTLHDGVLQTLAVVERRATDPVLARMAREQERELREYLFGVARSRTGDADGAGAGGAAPRGPGAGGGDLGSALRAVAARFEDAFEGRATVAVADDVPPLAAERVAALAGAAGEALVNAGKHGRATRVTVFAEPAHGGGVFCSVKDDGAGFDVAATPPGQGITRSIRARMEEMGGTADVTSRPGSGTEVCLWLP